MRRFGLLHLTCCLALAVPTAARAQATPATGAKPPAVDPQAPAQPAQPATPDAGVETSRSLFERTWRAVPDRRAVHAASTAIRRDFSAIRTSGMACSSPMRAMRARIRTERGASKSGRTTSDGGISATSATTSKPAASPFPGMWDQIPQFYSVDTRTPYTTANDTLAPRRRDAARDPERAGDAVGLRADRDAVRSTGAA